MSDAGKGKKTAKAFRGSDDSVDARRRRPSLDSALPRPKRRLATLLILVVLVISAGCGGIVPTDRQSTRTPAETPTQSPVPSSTPTPTTGSTAAPTASDRSADQDTGLDDDGLSAERERLLGTDPTVADTDGDGVTDGREVELGTDPLLADTDDDGLDDRAELNGATDPRSNDTDSDGLLDGRELELGTNATDPDSDDDGLNDGAELATSTDPLAADTDDDGVIDGREVELGTDPLVADTDDDGLDDRAELDGTTDPLSNDTDEDGLLDGRELELGTNATNPDTDGDSLLDGWEVRGRTPGGADLPDADPLQMDIYVLVSHADESWQFRESDRRYVRGSLGAVPVENPDGTTGISVHFADGDELPIRREFDNNGSARRALRRNSTPEFMGPRHGVYHHVILMRLDDDSDVFGGYATTPGRRVLVDEDARGSRGGTIPYRDRRIVSGLLQNVLGRPAPEYQDQDHPRFAKTGWTAYQPNDLRANEYLPTPLIERLERDGFATSPQR